MDHTLYLSQYSVVSTTLSSRITPSVNRQWGSEVVASLLELRWVYDRITGAFTVGDHTAVTPGTPPLKVNKHSGGVDESEDEDEELSLRPRKPARNPSQPSQVKHRGGCDDAHDAEDAEDGDDGEDGDGDRAVVLHRNLSRRGITIPNYYIPPAPRR